MQRNRTKHVVPSSEIVRRNKAVRAVAFLPMNIKNIIQKQLFRYSPEAKVIESFKDKYKGKSCYVIGNGPSLSIEILDKLAGRYTFSSNMLYKLFRKTEFRPSFYVATDPNFYPDYMNELLEYDIGDIFVTTVAKRKMTLPSNVHCVCVSGPFSIIKERMKNPDFSSDASKYLAMSYTVTFYALQLALYMGFSTVYLVGVDHRYAVTANQDGIIQIDKSVKASHIEGLEASPTSSLQAVDSTTFSYYMAAQYALRNDKEIYNTTANSALHVFEERCFDDSLNDERSLI